MLESNLSKHPHHMRDLDFKFFLLNGESTASCKITAGKIYKAPNGINFSLNDHTLILCSILGPYEERRKRIKPTFTVYPNRMRLSIFIRPSCGGISNRYRNYECIINKLLQSIITTNTLPQCGLSFVMQIFNDSGSLLAHLINSAVVSCIIGSIPIEFIPIAVSIGVTKHFNSSDIKSQFIVDPSNEDLKECYSVITIVCDPTKDLIVSINMDIGLCLLDKFSHQIMLELAMMNAKYIREEIKKACNNYSDYIRRLFIENNTNEPNLIKS